MKAAVANWRFHGAALLMVAVFLGGDLLITDTSELQRWWNDLGWTLASGAAALSCFRAAARLTGGQRRAWLLYGLGCLSWFLGMLIWDFRELVQGRITPFPGIADAAFLSFAPLFMVGLIYHATASPSVIFTVRNFADIGLIVCAALIGTAILLVEPLRSNDFPTIYRITALAYPVLYISAFLTALLVLTRYGAVARRGRRVLVLLVGSLALHAFSDSMYAFSLLDHTFRPGHYLDVFWILAFALTAVAAHEQGAHPVADSAGPVNGLDQRARRVEALVFTATFFVIGALAILRSDHADRALWREVAFLFAVLAVFLGLREWANAGIQEDLIGGLRRSERELGRILDRLQDVYFRTDGNGRLVRCSPSAEGMLGTSPEALMGRGFDTLFANVDEAHHFVQRLLEHGSVDNFEARWRQEQGGETRVSINAHLLDRSAAAQGWEGTARNVTAQRRAEAQMFRLSSALEQTADAVMITDRDGVIEYINPAFSSVTGYSRDEALGAKPNLIKSNRHDERFYQRMWEQIARGDVFTEVFVNRRKDGSLYYEAKTITPVIDQSGNIVSFISTGKDITEHMETQEQLRFLAEHDVLTALPNRQVLIERMRQSLARARRRNLMVATLFMDIDQFKYVNDSLGHEVGDELLIQIAKRLVAHVREGDTVARFGGDEFVVVLDDAGSVADITGVAEKLLNALTPPFRVNGMELHATASMGISVFPSDGPDSETLLRNADNAMYRAKEAGRNSYRFFSGDMSARAFERLTLENSLRNALERNQFELYYQPQLRIENRQVVGIEALLRWNHPEFGLVSPDDFIPLLEDTGLIVQVGEWVLDQACRQMQCWVEAELIRGRIAVNISARQFADMGFRNAVRRTLQTSGLAPQHLELEMTESIFLRESRDTSETLNTMSELGVGLAIDDFGTGYSSLSYLKRFPIDTLKIDRSFIRDITEDSDDEALSAAIVAMAQRLNLRVVAEGVETEAQLELLRKFNCELVQGYLFSRPLTAATMQRYLAGADARAAEQP